jgi:predicted molibdopterin-dependent oxidoreductase YjgC
MGICYQCLVEINGVPDQRACMTPVKPGMDIVTCPSQDTTPDQKVFSGGHFRENQGKGPK